MKDYVTATRDAKVVREVYPGLDAVMLEVDGVRLWVSNTGWFAPSRKRKGGRSKCVNPDQKTILEALA